MADRAPITPVTIRTSLTEVKARRTPPHVVQVPGTFRHPLAPVATNPQPMLLPVLAMGDSLTPALEAVFAPVVHRAHAGDIGARNALYTAFEPKLLRFARRITIPFAPYGSQPVWDRDDVYQEVFLVFASVLDTWHDGIPFGRYLLANYPWRLRDAIHRGIGKRMVPPRMMAIPMHADIQVADARTADAESVVIVESLADSLGPRLAPFMRLRVLSGMSQGEARDALGLSDRTASRNWNAIRRRLHLYEGITDA